MEDDLNIFLMEDELKFFQMEDDLNLFQMKNNLNLLANGRQTQKKIMRPKTIRIKRMVVAAIRVT